MEETQLAEGILYKYCTKNERLVFFDEEGPSPLQEFGKLAEVFPKIPPYFFKIRQVIYLVREELFPIRFVEAVDQGLFQVADGHFMEIISSYSESRRNGVGCGR